MESMPIVFEPALQKAGSAESMIARVPGAALRFNSRGINLRLGGTASGELHIGFAGAAAQARPRGMEPMESHTNYLLGSDPAGWRTHVANFSRVLYTGIYPGIDAVFYGAGQQLEHDFLVAPGADYRLIRMRLPPQAHTFIAPNGDLRIMLAGGELRMHRPLVYQEGPQGREMRSGAFHKLANGDIGFTVGGFDPKRTLIIDPVLSFSTYLMSQGGEGTYIATDAAGNSYVTGVGDLSYPVTPGAFPGCSLCVSQEVVTYVAKFSADGKTLLYSTLVGGSAYTQPFRIAVDQNGDAVIAGRTQSADFPVKNGQSIGTNNGFGSEYAFLTSLSADGSSLNFSTLLGGNMQTNGSSSTEGTALALDAAGNAYISGTTDSPGFPVTPGALNSGPPSYPTSYFTIFLSKFGPAGQLVYSALLGTADPQNGGGGPIGASGVAVDAADSAYVTGQAGSLWPVTSGAYQPQIAGAMPYAAPFVTKISANGASRVYSTFLGDGYQQAGIAVLPNGNVMVAGSGPGANYPVTPDAYQASNGSSYLSELNATGTQLVYSTLFGTSSTIGAFALDPDGDIWIAGQNGTGQFPLVKPLQSVLPLPGSGVTSVAYIAQFDPTAHTLKFSSFFGGTIRAFAEGLAIDRNHRAHMSGAAEPGMYTTPGAYVAEEPPSAPFNDATYDFQALIDSAAEAPALCIAYPQNSGLFWGPITVGTGQDIQLKVTSCGTQPLTISSIAAADSVFTVPPATNQCTQSLPVGQSCTVSIRFAPTAKADYGSTLTFQSNASIPEAVLPLYGSGVVPQISLLGGDLVFDSTLVGQTTRPAALFVLNQGGAPLVVDLTKTTLPENFKLSGDQDCAQPVQSQQACVIFLVFTPTAPGTRTATIQIASNDPSSPLTPASLIATGYSAAPQPQITSLSTQTVAAGTTGMKLDVFGFGFLPSSVVQLNGKPQATTFNRDGWLSAAVDATAIPATVYGEIPVTVTTPAPGGGQSDPYALTLYQTLKTQTGALLYEPVSKLLYASIPSTASANPNTVLPIDPVTAAPGPPIPVGNGPGALAASADGAYLYVALDGDHAIQRINLATRAIERTFSLPVDPSFALPPQVSDMHVIPGAPRSIVATLSTLSSPPEDGIVLFNDAGLVSYLPPEGAGNVGNRLPALDNFAFTNDPSTLYAQPFEFLEDPSFFTIVTLDSAGLHYTPPAAGSHGASDKTSGSDVASDGKLLYTSAGEVWDPKTHQLLHTYPVPFIPQFESVVPDTAHGKTFFLDTYSAFDHGGTLSIRAYDQASLAQTGTLWFGSDQNRFSGSATQLVRWGANGFAFRNSALTGADHTNDAVLLLTTSIVGGSNLNPAPVATTIAPASVLAGGPDFTLTVTGSSFIPGSTVMWNGSPRLTTFVSATQLTASIYAADVAATGSVAIGVTSPGPGGGSSNAVPLTVTAELPPAPAPQVTLTPATLKFSAQSIGAASMPQAVMLQNSGNADLNGIAITLSGANAASFAQNTTCGATLAAGASCTVSIVFTPGAAGDASATLNIADNAGGSPQSVPLTGTGAAPVFAVSPAAGGATTTTVTAGQPATYTLVLTPAASYSGAVALSCSNLPAHASCTFTPPSLHLGNGAPAVFTMVVSTAATQASSTARVLALSTPMLGVTLLPVWFLNRRRRYTLSCLGAATLAIAVVAGLCISGCGGGGRAASAPAPTSSAGAVAPGTYTFQVIATDGTTSQQQSLTLVVKGS